MSRRFEGLVTLLASVLLLALWPRLVHADVQRFAIVIGNNEGDARDGPLRYAESDAQRVYDVLRDLGGFSPTNIVLLQGESGRTVENTVIAVNERVRIALSQPGSQVMLFVYYSGHADAEALHLGRTRLSTRLLSQLVHGSAATFRMMVLDACRSGALTRSKGGHIVGGAPLLTEEALPGSGLAVLAASAAHEDAQESEEIRGSFFTHAFVSGLLGAADQDGDGAIALGEAYQYAYNATVRATSRTVFGTQHPTFRFDFAGQGAVILTRPESFAASRAVLQFPQAIGFLVLRDGAEGTVLGEVGPYDRRRTLSVRPGRYFVRGRGRDVLFEGGFDLGPGTRTQLDLSAMERVDYAQLVRKGGRDAGLAQAVRAGAWLRTRLSNADGPCVGGFVGYAVELEHFGVRGRAGACTSRFSNQRIDAVINEYDLELRLARSFDLSALSFDIGLGAGAALFTQRFTTRGAAPSRDSLGPYLVVGGGAGYELGGGYTFALDATFETHFLRMEASGSDQSGAGEFAVRFNAAVAKAF